MSDNIRKFPARKGSSGNGEVLPDPSPPTPEKGASRLPAPGSGAGKSRRQVIDISEMDFLKFQATKLREQLIVMERAKLKSDEGLVKVSQDFLEIRAENLDTETRAIYKSLNINIGDTVVETEKGFKIIRGGAIQR